MMGLYLTNLMTPRVKMSNLINKVQGRIEEVRFRSTKTMEKYWNLNNLTFGSSSECSKMIWPKTTSRRNSNKLTMSFLVRRQKNRQRKNFWQSRRSKKSRRRMINRNISCATNTINSSIGMSLSHTSRKSMNVHSVMRPRRSLMVTTNVRTASRRT